jgi:hypothetical protein
MDMFNKMTITADDKKSKKGDGINSVLKFMIDVRDFQDKLEDCIEAQALGDNQAKLKEYPAKLDELYKALAEIASSSVRRMREDSGLEEDAVRDHESPNPVMVNAPQVPKLT